MNDSPGEQCERVITLVNVYVALPVYTHIASTSYAYFMEYELRKRLVFSLARLHEVQKSYCSHPGRTRSRSRYRSRSTLR